MYWLPHDTAETDGLKQGEICRSQPYRVTIPLTSGLSFISVQTAGAHWLTDAVHPFVIQYAVFGTDWYSEPFQPYGYADIRSV